MTKTNNILDLLDAGIKAQTLRQKSIANNIANLETPGYRRIDVKFEEILSKSLESDDNVDLQDIEPELYTPKNTQVKENGNDVNLDSEVGQLIDNSLQYKAYIRLLDKKYRQIELAMQMK